MKKFLFITNFYEPEIGAASHRISSLVSRLLKDGYKIYVFTVWPLFGNDNNYKILERKTNIIILRLPLYRTTSKNIFLRSISMLNFSIYLILFIPFFLILNIKNVFIQGHPLISSFFAVAIFKLLKKNIVLNVSDLWPKSGLDLGIFKKGRFYKFLKKIEKFNYLNSNIIITQSAETKNYIIDRFSFDRESIGTFYNVPQSNQGYDKNLSPNNTKLIYAGLLGHAQDIASVCRNLYIKNESFEFHIYGEGSQMKDIEKIASRNPRIILHKFVNKKELNKTLSNFDLALVSLKDNIHGALPSKIFEYMNHKIPIIFMGDGEGKEIITKYNLGWTFKSDDYKKMNIFLNSSDFKSQNTLRMQKDINNTLINVFSYEKQYKNFIKLVDTL